MKKKKHRDHCYHTLDLKIVCYMWMYRCTTKHIGHISERPECYNYIFIVIYRRNYKNRLELRWLSLHFYHSFSSCHIPMPFGITFLILSLAVYCVDMHVELRGILDIIEMVTIWKCLAVILDNTMKNISEDFALTLTSSSYPSTIVTMLVKSEQGLANLKYFLILNWILNRSTKSYIFELDSTSLHNYPKPKSFCLCGHHWLSAENCTFSQIFIVRGEDSTISDRMGS